MSDDTACRRGQAPGQGTARRCGRMSPGPVMDVAGEPQPLLGYIGGGDGRNTDGSLGMLLGVRLFVLAVFLALGLSFMAPIAVLMWEFRDSGWLTLATFYSHLFMFFPTFGVVTLCAFYTPGCAFTDMYWKWVTFGRIRFTIGLLAVSALSVVICIALWQSGDSMTVGAFAAFVAAGISDGVDGYIAREFNQRSELGAYLDPIADKALLVSIYVSLGFLKFLPAWLVILAVSRDVMIVTAILLAYVLGQPMRVKPLFISKANTTAQILLALMTLADAGFGLGLGIVRFSLVWVTAVLTAISAAAYLRSWLQHMTAPAGATER